MNKTYFLNSPSGHEVQIDETQCKEIAKAIEAGKQVILLNGNPLNLAGVSIFDEPKPRKGMWFCKFGQWHANEDSCGCYESRQKQVEEVFGAKKLTTAQEQCRGQYSIHLDLIQIAIAEKRIKDLKRGTSWRKETLAKLRTTRKDWCDSTFGKCFCDADFKPDAAQKRLRYKEWTIGKTK